MREFFLYNSIMSVNFFYGVEDFNIELEIEKMKSKLNPDFISISFQVHDNPEYQELINILRTPPMMFGDSLIVINSEKYFLIIVSLAFMHLLRIKLYRSIRRFMVKLKKILK